jgi:heme-degrading monooxygenase HmoA
MKRESIRNLYPTAGNDIEGKKRTLVMRTRVLGLAFAILLLAHVKLYSQSGNTSPESQNRKASMQQILIDKFIVPPDTKAEFLRRMSINRNFIKTLPGFVQDAAYEQTGGDSEFNYVTVAVWENAEAFESARKAVTAEYQKQGFDLKEFLKKSNIKIDRAVYRIIVD